MILQASNLVKKYQRRGETFAAVDGVSLMAEKPQPIRLM